jgi:tetratricopeptide (TPR) repeat protein
VLGRFYLATGLPEQGTALIESNLDLLPSHTAPEEMIVPLESLLLAALQFGQHTKARTLIQEGLKLTQQIDDQWSEAWFLYWLGVVMLAQEEYEQVQQVAQDSLLLATRCGDLWLRACLCSFVLAKAASALKDYNEATKQYQQGLAFFEMLGQPWGISVSYWNLGNTAYQSKNYEEAESSYRQSLKIATATGQFHLNIGVLSDFATLLSTQGKKGTAAVVLKYILHEPHTSEELRTHADRALRELMPSLSPADVKTFNAPDSNAALADLLPI